jgi:hypothetical protein
MFTPLAKLAIGLSATMATAFYYLAAAPPASAQFVCGPGNFSAACGKTPPSPTPQPSPTVIADPVEEVLVEEVPASRADPVEEVPVVEPPASIADPVEEVSVVESPPPIADPVQEVPATEPAVIAPPGDLGNIYPSPTTVRPTAIPEPGTVVALLVTGAGIICCGRKRNKQVRQQR